MQNANKVALNSLALYLNMLVTMGATLLGTRFVLKALGETEYGVYVLVADIVAMFSFLNVSMAASTQRYLSYAIGEGNEHKLKEIFYYSISIHAVIALILVAVLIGLGLPAVNMWLDIPVHIRTDAMLVLACMAVSTVFIVLAVPYEGAMNAHEDIYVIAGINVFDALFKLFAAVIVFFVPSGRLLLYAAMIMTSGILVFLLKKIYSDRHYSETRFKLHRLTDFALVKEMTGFAGWNLIGTGCSLLRYQGAAIMLNKFFGLVTNAAYGVAQQLNGFLLFFANSSVRPMRPIIIKSEGAGNHKQMIRLTHTVSKVTFLMLSVAIVPLYVNMPYILELWLSEVPDGALHFCRGFILIVLIGQLSVGLQIALESKGRIKRLQIVVGLMHAVPLFAAYPLFLLGFPSYVILYCVIVEELICLFLRVWIAWRDADVAPFAYLRTVVLPCTLCAAMAFVASYLCNALVLSLHPLFRVIVSVVIVLLVVATIGYFLCINSWERGKILSMLSSFRKKHVRR